MSPLQFARTACANFQPDGGCLGVSVEGLGNGAPTCPRAKCLLAEKPSQRCGYFEQVVLPLADAPSPKNRPKLQAERLSARAEYGGAAGVRRAVRTCPECGTPLAKRQRVCSACKRRRRRQQWQAEKQRQRRAACPTVKPILPAVNPCQQRSEKRQIPGQRESGQPERKCS